jgi:methylated-DNA-[protein]-cysteine S-methyltransferase
MVQYSQNLGGCQLDTVTSLYNSPIGNIVVSAGDSGIREIFFTDGPIITDAKPNFLLDRCVTQLGEYFNGKRTVFDVQLDISGTEFQMSVWRALLSVPYGETLSYGGIAEQIGRPKAVRAVGGANHHNPVSIIVPCHRIIGSDGSLTGYGGGLWRKEWLLNHEAKFKSGM